MLRATRILGHRDDPAFAGRALDAVQIGWADAVRRRLRCETTGGLDIAIDVPRGTFLADGAVIADDGARVVVVERARAPVLLVHLDPSSTAAEQVRAAALVGHAFGNQHAPIEVIGGQIRVPLTTSASIATATVENLHLAGVRCEVAEVPLACAAPLAGDAGHRHDGSGDLGHHHHHHHSPAAGGELHHGR